MIVLELPNRPLVVVVSAESGVVVLAVVDDELELPDVVAPVEEPLPELPLPEVPPLELLAPALLELELLALGVLDVGA
jgi:hypothetical protein